MPLVKLAFTREMVKSGALAYDDYHSAVLDNWRTNSYHLLYYDTDAIWESVWDGNIENEEYVWEEYVYLANPLGLRSVKLSIVNFEMLKNAT